MDGSWRRRFAILVSTVALGFAAATVARLDGGVQAQAIDRVPDPAILATIESVVSGEGAPPSPTTDTPPTPAAPTLAKPLVILYGDSLAWEAEDAFVAAFAGTPGVQVLTRTWGGTAICDWFDEMEADEAAFAPGAVVLEFSGNALTPCMRDAAGRSLVDDAYWDRYRTDAATAIDIFAATDTRVFFVGAPISQHQELTGDFHGGLMNAMYADIAAQHTNAAYVDAGAAVLDHGHWTQTLPCLPSEPCTGGTDVFDRGYNVVRALDGGHFCPTAGEATAGVVTACSVWSSGAYRYANAMAAPVLAALPR